MLLSFATSVYKRRKQPNTDSASESTLASDQAHSPGCTSNKLNQIKLLGLALSDAWPPASLLLCNALPIVKGARSFKLTSHTTCKAYTLTQADRRTDGRTDGQPASQPASQAGRQAGRQTHLLCSILPWKASCSLPKVQTHRHTGTNG